jgi:hypothetical protein
MGSFQTKDIFFVSYGAAPDVDKAMKIVSQCSWNLMRDWQGTPQANSSSMPPVIGILAKDVF